MCKVTANVQVSRPAARATVLYDLIHYVGVLGGWCISPVFSPRTKFLTIPATDARSIPQCGNLRREGIAATTGWAA